MALYLLNRTERNMIDYEENVALVVRAPNEEAARVLAAKHCAFEGPATWLYPSKSTCEVVAADGESAIVLVSYNKG